MDIGPESSLPIPTLLTPKKDSSQLENEPDNSTGSRLQERLRAEIPPKQCGRCACFVNLSDKGCETEIGKSPGKRTGKKGNLFLSFVQSPKTTDASSTYVPQRSKVHAETPMIVAKHKVLRQTQTQTATIMDLLQKETRLVGDRGVRDIRGLFTHSEGTLHLARERVLGRQNRARKLACYTARL